MSNYHTVTICPLPESVNLADLPDFDLSDVEDWDATGTLDGPMEAHFAGHSKWADDGDILKWALDFTREHSGVTITHSDEWDTRDADESGRTVSVYRDGALVPSGSRYLDLVPWNLAELIGAVRAPLAAYDAVESDDDPGYHKRVDAAIDLIDVARALVDALDPEGAKR